MRERRTVTIPSRFRDGADRAFVDDRLDTSAERRRTTASSRFFHGATITHLGERPGGYRTAFVPLRVE